MAIRLIAGLGNPGSEYDQTRHNAGTWFVQQLALRHQGLWRPDTKCFGMTAKINVKGEAILLLQPTTFMNRSGQSVAAAAQFYKIEPTDILVAHDELDLAPGTARFKLDGGHGGHNGIRDIIPALGNRRDFMRLRVGIGHPGNAKAVSSYVLGKPDQTDKHAIDAAINEALATLSLVFSGDMIKAMTQLHSFTAAHQ